MKRITTLCGLLLVCCIGQSAAAQNPVRGFEEEPVYKNYSKRYALVIGIDYEDRNGKPKELQNAEKDAKDVAKVLKEIYDYEVVLLTGKDAKKADISLQLEILCKKTTVNDCFLFYFAGHGTRKDTNKGNIGLIFPHDVKYSKNDNTLYSSSCLHIINNIKAFIDENCHARHKLIILDSCNSGQIFGESRSGEPSTNRLNLKAKVFYAIASCQAYQRASDGALGRNSPFAKTLMQLLDPKTSPYYKKPKFHGIAASDLFLKIKSRLKERKIDQEPIGNWLETDKEFVLADYYFIPPKHLLPGSNAAVAKKLDHRFLLQTLPSVDGEWWFDEMPWFLPGKRHLVKNDEFIFDHVTAAPLSLNVPPKNPERDPATKTARFLYKANVPAFQQALRKNFDKSGIDPALRLLLDVRDLETKSQAKFDEDIEKLKKLAEKQTNDTDLAATWYLIALVQHKCGCAGAGESYKKAYRLYTKQTPKNPDHQLLTRLFLADYARWLVQYGGNADRELAKDYCRTAGKSCDPNAGVYLLIDLLATEALANRRLQKWREMEKCYEQAMKIAVENLAADHPLLAHLHERQAWAFMDQWKIKDAEEQFSEAAKIRLANWESSKNTDFNAKIKYFHNKHGLAMIKRFKGYPAQACADYEHLIKEVREAYASNRPKDKWLQRKYTLLLNERLTNTYCRLLDSYLFSYEPGSDETACLQKAYKEIDFEYDSITSSLPKDLQASAKCQWLYRKAIVAALLPDKARAAGAALAEAEKMRKKLIAEDGDLEIYHQLAKALAAISQEAENNRHAGKDKKVLKVLRDLVDTCMAKGAQKITRAEMELLLYGNQLLLHYDVAFQEDDAAVKDDLADGVALCKLARDKTSAADRQTQLYTRTYLRRYYNSQIEIGLRVISSTGEYMKLVRQIYQAKTGNEENAFQFDRNKAALVFYMQKSRGHVILYAPKQQSPFQHFALPFGSEAVKDMTKKSIQLPEDCRNALAKVEGLLQVYWNDPVEGLDAGNYRFAEQIKGNLMD